MLSKKDVSLLKEEFISNIFPIFIHLAKTIHPVRNVYYFNHRSSLITFRFYSLTVGCVTDSRLAYCFIELFIHYKGLKDRTIIYYIQATRIIFSRNELLGDMRFFHYFLAIKVHSSILFVSLYSFFVLSSLPLWFNCQLACFFYIIQRDFNLQKH